MSSDDQKKKIENAIEKGSGISPIYAVIHAIVRVIRNWLLDEHPGDPRRNNNNNNSPPQPSNFTGNTGNNITGNIGNNANIGNIGDNANNLTANKEAVYNNTLNFGDSKSGDNKSGDSKSGDNKSGDSKSGESKSGESK